MQPKSIQRDDLGIKITWEDGHESVYPEEFLRRRCPCAVCREIPERDAFGVLPPVSAPGAYSITAAAPIGWYALQFTFGDGHDTGIFSYEMMRAKCPCSQCHPQ